jgi:hypothetical protein
MPSQRASSRLAPVSMSQSQAPSSAPARASASRSADARSTTSPGQPSTAPARRLAAPTTSPPFGARAGVQVRRSSTRRPSRATRTDRAITVSPDATRASTAACAARPSAGTVGSAGAPTTSAPV